MVEIITQHKFYSITNVKGPEDWSSSLDDSKSQFTSINISSLHAAPSIVGSLIDASSIDASLIVDPLIVSSPIVTPRL